MVIEFCRLKELFLIKITESDKRLVYLILLISDVAFTIDSTTHFDVSERQIGAEDSAPVLF